jgi:hypothetical protein
MACQAVQVAAHERGVAVAAAAAGAGAELCGVVDEPPDPCRSLLELRLGMMRAVAGGGEGWHRLGGGGGIRLEGHGQDDQIRLAQACGEVASVKVRALDHELVVYTTTVWEFIGSVDLKCFKTAIFCADISRTR